jgi:hypothetical protein
MKIKQLLMFCVLFTALAYSQFQNIQISSPNSNSPNEVSIAINPLNPDIIVGGANISYFYSSTNRGATWSQKTMTSTLGVWGDPCLVYDHRGYLYYGHLSNPTVGYWIDRIVVQRSTDNGITWNNGAGVGLTPPKEQDKEWIAADYHSPLFKGNIYMSWTEFDNYGSGAVSDSTRILLSRSTDAGVTWSPGLKVSDRSGDCIDEDNTVEGAVPAVGPNGEVYVSWTGPYGIMFDKSLDGGLTFGTDKFVAPHPGGWDYAIPGIYRANGLTITVCDTSKSIHRGNVYICWSDQGTGTNNTDVYIARSTDGGNNWSAPIRVNNDNTSRHQFFCWLTVDQATGVLYSIFYDRRNTTSNLTDVYIAKSVDGGLTWENFKVSQSSFNPSSSVFFGDYTGISAFQGRVYPIWMRADNTTMSIWTAPFFDSAAVLPVELSGFSANVEENTIFLDWQTATEVNNKGFEVERAKLSSAYDKNYSFTKVGFVKGRGTSLYPVRYYFEDARPASGFYKYRLKQLDMNGEFTYSNEILIDLTHPNRFELFQNYPNPFNPSTVISFEIPKAGFVSLKVYDIAGNLVTTLVNSYKPVGVHEVDFNISNVKSTLSTGVYIYRIEAEGFVSSKKMIFLK